MSEKKFDTRTPEERMADLEERRKTQVIMTSKEAEDWNKAQGTAPLSPKHWSVEAGRIKHVINMGHLWKQLAKTLSVQLKESRSHAEEWESIANEASRQLTYCNKCSAAPGEECTFGCTRDGSREVE